jgi:hypothetical protein
MSPRLRHLPFACALVLLLSSVAHGQAQRSAPPRPTAPPPAAAPTAAPTARKVPFAVGETLSYDVGWSTYVTAGTATFTVQDVRPADGGGSAFYIAAEAKPTGLVASLYTLYYKADTLLDTRTLLPLRGSTYSQEGTRRRTKITRFDQGAQRADFEVRTPTVVKSSTALPKYTQDILSAVYALRAIPLKESAAFTMPVCDGGQLYRVRFSIGKIETVRAGSASLPAFKVTPTITDSHGKTVGRAMTIWISADARQAPLRVQADLTVGSITMTLRPAS